MNRIIRNISLAAMLLLVLACRKQNDGVQGEAALMISINEISAGTKALPSEIAKPSVTDFKISVVEQKSGHSIFSGKLSKAEQKIKVKPDEDYRVIAEYGKNAGVEIDAPYYIGTSDVVRVGLNQVETVQINCALGNALISAVYGATASEQQRFQELYSSYGLYVSCEGTEVFMSGTKNAYIKAGSSYTVEMKAISRQDNSEKRFIVPGLPQQLGAKEKLKITFSLGQGAEINVEKAELVDEDVAAGIPFDWFPAPKLTATHRFAQDGTLLGTKLETESSFPGCRWKAEVRNANNVIVRTLSGEDSLSSDYDASAEWPYIPSGSYTVSYSYEFNDKTYNFPKTGQFEVPSPETMVLELEEGYTSYDLYKKGDISGANACDKGTIYAPTAKLAISETILSNSNYINLPVTYIAKVDNNQLSDTKSLHVNTLKMDNAINLASKADAYEYSVEVKFDGCTSTKSETHYITGLPVTYTPPSNNSGWSWVNQRDGAWNSDHVKLATGAVPASEARTPDYYLPQDVNVYVTSELDQYGSLFGIKCGYEVKFVNKNTTKKYTTDNPRAFYYHEGTLSGKDYITIKNTYVAAGYYLRVYSVKIEYR